MTDAEVKLYVYDLSNGLARALSLPLTGRQIDGIWHTSVVVWDREIFYGAGVMETAPGRSHHGQPLHVIPCGRTQIPLDVFDDYLSDLKQRYTAGNYHLLEFNCNSFTQDVVGFLTGTEIPAWISSLPADFLSTPFGQQMKPQIDAMYTGRSGGAAVVGSPSGQGSAGSQGNAMGMGLGGLLAGIAGKAAGPSPPSSAPTSPSDLIQSTASSLMIITNPTSFDACLASHPNSIALFRSSSSSSSSAGPSAVKSKFEEMAKDEAAENKVDLEYLVVDVGVGKGEEVAAKCGVESKELERGPVVVLFKQGVKSDVLMDLDPDELEAAIVWHIAQVQEGRTGSS